MRRTYLATPALMTLALVVVGCSWVRTLKPNSPDPAPPTRPTTIVAVGQTAPDLDGDDTTGQRLHLADYRGNVVVVHFWANW
jgi:cytochrome oxidase Cu insertion factor (SCO1/SenC/PrrC family)